MQGRTGPEYKLTSRQESKVTSMYSEGGSIKGIAHRLDVNEKTVRALLLRAGVSLRGRSGHRKFPKNSIHIDMAVNRYLLGASTEELGEAMGMSAGAVAKRLEDAGVKLRAPGFQRGVNHHAWKGGRIERDDGHILVLVYPDDPYYSMGQIKGDGKDGSRYVLENRLVMARKLGRCLTEDETVHHKDLNKTNNSPRNLQLRQGKHGKGAVFCCADCGSYNVKATELAS